MSWVPRCSRCHLVVKPVKKLSVTDYKPGSRRANAIWVSRAWHCARCLYDEFIERVALVQEGARLSPEEAVKETKRQFGKMLGNRSWSQEAMF